MTQDSRVVRELLDANLALTSQFVELARLVIGAPSVEYALASTYEEQADAAPVPPQFEISSADDWPDIPDRPLSSEDRFDGEANVIHIHRRPDPREVSPDLPLHMSEEEEDLRFEVGHALAEPKTLSDYLAKLGAPSAAVLIDPLA